MNQYYTVVADLSQKQTELQVVMLNASFTWSPPTENQPESNLDESMESNADLITVSSTGAIREVESGNRTIVLENLNLKIKKVRICLSFESIY